METMDMMGMKMAFFPAEPGSGKAASGQVTVPKTKISDENGYMAFFIDSEGNRVGLHSQQ